MYCAKISTFLVCFFLKSEDAVQHKHNEVFWLNRLGVDTSDIFQLGKESSSGIFFCVARMT